jgi:hypothetical protein
MLNTTGYEKIIQNVFKLAKPYIKGEVVTANDLKGYYLQFLENYSKGIIINKSDDLFIRDLDIETNLTSAYGESTLNDLKQAQLIGLSVPLPEEIKNEKINFAREALQSLLETDEKLALIFKLVIHSIFLRESSRIEGVPASFGGSTSQAIGVICISDIHKMTKLDVMEVLLHELTHTLVFIEELNYPLFQYDEIKKPENFARSAILLKSRPLDKVVHSIVVGTEIIVVRKKHSIEGKRNVHPKTDKLVLDVLSSCMSVLEAENVAKALHPQCLLLVNKCFNICQESKSENGLNEKWSSRTDISEVML